MYGLFKYKSHKYVYSLQGMNIAEISFDGKTGVEKINCINKNAVYSKLRWICTSVVLKNGAYIIPFRGDYIYKIEIQNKYLKEVCDVSDVFEERTFLYGGKLDDSTIWAYSKTRDSFVTYNEKTNIRKDYHIPAPKFPQNSPCLNDIKDKILYEYDEIISLHDYLKILR